MILPKKMWPMTAAMFRSKPVPKKAAQCLTPCVNFTPTLYNYAFGTLLLRDASAAAAVLPCYMERFHLRSYCPEKEAAAGSASSVQFKHTVCPYLRRLPL